MRPLAVLLLAAALAIPADAAKPRSVTLRTVTIDVKDAEARVVLKSMQKQCGIRNMIIDPEVQATGATFKFTEVPCDVAFRVVFRTYGLAAQVHPNSVMTVESR